MIKMKITITKGINADGRNYRRIIYTNDQGTEECGSYQLSRMITHTTSETDKGVFIEGKTYVVKGDQELWLTPITPEMDDETRARIIVERIHTARRWADHIATEIKTTVEG
jgi:hypothetical protein